MSKYNFAGGIDDRILDMEVVACRGSMNEQPKGLLISRQSDNDVSEITADERFMIVLKLNGVWVASLHPQEVKQDSRG